MTEKRFTYKHFDWLQWHIYDNGEYLVEASGNEEEDIKPLVDLLNYLNDENEQLKQSLKNKMESDVYWEQKATEKIKELEEENKQLKQSMDNLFNYFSKWFEDERGIYIEEFSEMWDTIKNRRE